MAATSGTGSEAPPRVARLEADALDAHRIAGLVALGTFLLGAPLLRSVVQNGDAAMYNEQIQAGAFGERTTHIGYLLLGAVFHALLPLDVDTTMNAMCLAFAAAGAAAVYSIALGLTGEKLLSLGAPLLLLSIGSYARGAVLSEVDVPCSALVLASVAAWVHGRRSLAGVAYGAAMTISPVASSCLPLVVATVLPATPGKPGGVLRDHVVSVALFGVCALAVYLPVVAAVLHDYLHGGRGVLSAPRQPFDLAVQTERTFRYLGGAGGGWFALGLSGVLWQCGKRALPSLGAGTLGAIFATCLLTDRFLDVPVQMPQLSVLAAFTIVPLAALPRRFAGLLLGVVAALGVVPVCWKVRREVLTSASAVEDYRAMARLTPNLVGAGLSHMWNAVVPFEHACYGVSQLGVGYTWEVFPEVQAELRRYYPNFAIWAVTPPPPGAFAPFAERYDRETRVINGHEYEVWLPKAP